MLTLRTSGSLENSMNDKEYILYRPILYVFICQQQMDSASMSKHIVNQTCRANAWSM